jgi:hypothetical protein
MGYLNVHTKLQKLDPGFFNMSSLSHSSRRYCSPSRRPLRTLSRGGFGPGGARILLGISVLLMMVPTFLYVQGPLRQPLLTPGDKIIQSTCPDCRGLGQVTAVNATSPSTCRRCSGTGKVPYVVAGPKRPTQIIGHVYAPDAITPISNADVHLETGLVPIDLKTDPHGMFGVTLPPGNYTLNLKSPTGNYKRGLTVDMIQQALPADRDLTFLTLHEAFVTEAPKP